MVSVIDRASVSEFEPGKFSAKCPMCAQRVQIYLSHPGSHYDLAEGGASVSAHAGTGPAALVGVTRRSGLCAASDQVFAIGEPELAEVPQELIDEGFSPN